MASSYPMLRYGSSGQEVRRLQQALNRAGYSLEVDGGFGEKTRAALMDYQRRAGMTPDGVAGSKTWASLGLQSAQDRLADLEKGYTPSRETQEARRSWEELAARQPGDYTSPYADRMEDLLRQMESREAFSYDPSRDEMFRRYARLYQRQGQTAMEDTLGQAAVSSGWSDLCSRVGKLTHLGWPMVAGAVLLAALTLEKGAQKQSIYRAARLLVWAAYILLLNWRAGAMRLDADDCWLISVLGVPVAGAVYELLEQKGQVTAKWYHAPLALLALLTVSMAALQDMRFILLLVGLGVLWWICARLGTLAGKYKVVMQGFWGAAAMLLLAASRQLGTREAIPANWLVALALLGVSWCVLTVFLSVRYRAANAMEIYPEEYSTVYRLCNVVPLLAAVLAALCVVF